MWKSTLAVGSVAPIIAVYPKQRVLPPTASWAKQCRCDKLTAIRSVANPRDNGTTNCAVSEFDLPLQKQLLFSAGTCEHAELSCGRSIALNAAIAPKCDSLSGGELTRQCALQALPSMRGLGVWL